MSLKAVLKSWFYKWLKLIDFFEGGDLTETSLTITFQSLHWGEVQKKCQLSLAGRWRYVSKISIYLLKVLWNRHCFNLHPFGPFTIPLKLECMWHAHTTPLKGATTETLSAKGILIRQQLTAYFVVHFFRLLFVCLFKLSFFFVRISTPGRIESICQRDSALYT